jgi:ABC-type multidrug transport system permease subunit
MTLATHTYPQRQIQNGTTQIQRGLLLFLTWLFIGPLATNVITMINPKAQVFQVETYEGIEKKLASRGGYFTATSNASVTQLLEPTRLVAGLFVFVFFLNAIVRKSFGSFNRTELLMATFSLILAVNVLFMSKVVGYSIRIGMDAFVVPFLFYLMARRLITDEDRFQRLIRAIVYMGIYVIVISLIQRFMSESRFFCYTGTVRE